MRFSAKGLYAFYLLIIIIIIITIAAIISTCLTIIILYFEKYMFLIALRVEFTKPLTDLEVKEKESARFECEISRPGVKVCITDILIT